MIEGKNLQSAYLFSHSCRYAIIPLIFTVFYPVLILIIIPISGMSSYLLHMQMANRFIYTGLQLTFVPQSLQMFCEFPAPSYNSNANPQTNFCFDKIFTARCTLWPRIRLDVNINPFEGSPAGPWPIHNALYKYV